jgi:hypothetical protein
MLLLDPSKMALGVHRALGVEQVEELGAVVAVRGGCQRFAPPPPTLWHSIEHRRLDEYAGFGGWMGPDLA